VCKAPLMQEGPDLGRRPDHLHPGAVVKPADGWDTGPGGHGTIHRTGRQKGETGVPVTDNVTTGWKPGCECGANVVPCTVLDPFGGAGTTGLVADRLQRDAILIEINRDYVAMAERRIATDAPLFSARNGATVVDESREASCASLSFSFPMSSRSFPAARGTIHCTKATTLS
jgi:DNA methylase